MRGNSHVRFLGGKAPERELTYPTNMNKKVFKGVDLKENNQI